MAMACLPRLGEALTSCGLGLHHHPVMWVASYGALSVAHFQATVLCGLFLYEGPARLLPCVSLMPQPTRSQLGVWVFGSRLQSAHERCDLMTGLLSLTSHLCEAKQGGAGEEKKE